MEKSGGSGHCQGLPFPSWLHAASRLFGWGSRAGGPSYSGAGYCGWPDLLLSPDPGLEAAGVSPVSAALRELLGLTEALRIPWGLASPFFWSWGLDCADFLPMEGLLEPLGLAGSNVFRPRMLQ